MWIRIQWVYFISDSIVYICYISSGNPYLEVVTLGQQVVAFVPSGIQHQLGVVQLTGGLLNFLRGIMLLLHQLVPMVTHSGKMRLPALHLSLNMSIVWNYQLQIQAISQYWDGTFTLYLFECILKTHIHIHFNTLRSWWIWSILSASGTSFANSEAFILCTISFDQDTYR